MILDRGRVDPRTRVRAGSSAGSVLVLALAASPLWAQASRWEVDLTGSRIEYENAPSPLNAPSLAALSEWQDRSWYGRLTGSLTGFEDSGWSGQARGDLAGWISPFGSRSPARFELAASGGGSRHSSGFHSLIGRADARFHLVGRGFGGWAGVSVASARNSFDSTSVSGVVPSAGLWAQDGPLRATLSFAGTRVSGSTYPEVNGAITMTRGPLDVTAYAGARRAPAELGQPTERWAGATAAVWVHPRAALIVAGGRYSSDILQGLPSGRFFSIGVRFTRRRSRPIPTSAPAPIVYTPAAARSGSIGFEVEGAGRVEIAGDWTAWERVPLERDASGRWTLPFALEPGVYRFNLVVDGERWIVPPGVPEVEDGFGGRVGLLMISTHE